MHDKILLYYKLQIVIFKKLINKEYVPINIWENFIYSPPESIIPIFLILLYTFKKLKFCNIYRRFHYITKLFVEYHSIYIRLSYIIKQFPLCKSTPFIILHYLQPIAESNSIRRSGPNQAFQAIPYAVQRSGIVNNSSWKVWNSSCDQKQSGCTRTPAALQLVDN